MRVGVSYERGPPVRPWGEGSVNRRHAGARGGRILYEKSLNLKTISQGDFGHFRENIQIILSKVAKIAWKIVFKLKQFSHEIVPCSEIKPAAPDICRPQIRYR